MRKALFDIARQLSQDLSTAAVHNRAQAASACKGPVHGTASIRKRVSW